MASFHIEPIFSSKEKLSRNHCSGIHTQNMIYFTIIQHSNHLLGINPVHILSQPSPFRDGPNQDIGIHPTNVRQRPQPGNVTARNVKTCKRQQKNSTSASRKRKIGQHYQERDRCGKDDSVRGHPEAGAVVWNRNPCFFVGDFVRWIFLRLPIVLIKFVILSNTNN